MANFDQGKILPGFLFIDALKRENIQEKLEELSKNEPFFMKDVTGNTI